MTWQNLYLGSLVPFKFEIKVYSSIFNVNIGITSTGLLSAFSQMDLTLDFINLSLYTDFSQPAASMSTESNWNGTEFKWICQLLEHPAVPDLTSTRIQWLPRCESLSPKLNAGCGVPAIYTCLAAILSSNVLGQFCLVSNQLQLINELQLRCASTLVAIHNMDTVVVFAGEVFS
jgi:hypothetical protein